MYTLKARDQAAMKPFKMFVYNNNINDEEPVVTQALIGL